MRKFSGTIMHTADGTPSAVEVRDANGTVVGGWRPPYVDVWASGPSIRDEVYTAAMRTLGEWFVHHRTDIHRAESHSQ